MDENPPAVWPSRRRRLLRCLALLTALQAAEIGWRGIAAAVRQPTAGIRACRLDPNRGSLAELMALPGIGRSRAAAIILQRVRHGPFRRIEDLAEVDGLGTASLRALRPFLILPAADTRARGAGS